MILQYGIFFSSCLLIMIILWYLVVRFKERKEQNNYFILPSMITLVSLFVISFISNVWIVFLYLKIPDNWSIYSKSHYLLPLHIYTLIEFWLSLTFFVLLSSKILGNIKRKVCIAVGGLYTVFWLFAKITTLENFGAFDDVTVPLSCVVLSMIGIICYADIIKTSTLPLFSDARFYFVMSLLMYFLSSSFIFIFLSKFPTMWEWHATFEIIKNIGCLYGFYILIKDKTGEQEIWMQ